MRRRFPRFGVDATQLGVRAGGGADQSNMLQSAIDKTAGARVPLMLGPGDYRVGGLSLPSGTQLIGVRGATRLIFTGGSALISARGADHVTLAGLMLDGGGRPLPENGALVDFAQCSDLRIMDCEVTGSGRGGIRLDERPGHGVRHHRRQDRGRRDLFARCARADDPEQHRARRRQRRHPGASLGRRATTARSSSTTASRTSPTRAGGSGQYGNAINVFRAGNVIVRGNRISRAAFSAVRGNAASNIQITGNTATDLGEVAIYSEFGFEGAVIANNTVDGAALGIVGLQFQRGRPARGGAGQHDPQSQAEASGRHRAGRRRRRRHRGRGRRRRSPAT